MTLLDCSAILFANSLIVIVSGILISLLTGFKFSFVSCLFKFLFSFSLALFTDARLLSLASISSLKALDTVSFTSLLFDPNFDFFSFVSLSPLNLFVALCSASFRFSKSFELGKFLLFGDALEKRLLLKGFLVKPDFIVEKNGEKFIAEVKTGAVALIQNRNTRRQILEYSHLNQNKTVILVDIENRKIKKIDFNY